MRFFVRPGLWESACFEPVTIATLAVGAIGSAVSAVGAISAGEAQASQASYAAQVARNNATIANQNARYAMEAGAAKTEDEGLRARARLASVRAGIAASGLDPNTGSAADVQSSDRTLGYLDTVRTQQQAAMQAYGYRTQSTNFTAEAGLDTARASADQTAGFTNAAGDLLSGASSVGDKYLKYFGSTSSAPVAY